MRSSATAIVGSVAIFALAPFVLAPLACSDTPRGDQGIDFLVDGSYYSVPPSPEAAPDSQGPCAEQADAGTARTQLSGHSTAYTHLIGCTGGQTPADLQCMSTGDTPAGGVATFCCTTGLL